MESQLKPGWLREQIEKFLKFLDSLPPKLRCSLYANRVSQPETPEGERKENV